MARKHPHGDHVNHEAWAIPYGDLITLLLAFFVVMYALSSVNEGKYRALSDSLQAAFHGRDRALTPIQVGETQKGVNPKDDTSLISPIESQSLVTLSQQPIVDEANEQAKAELIQIATDLQEAMMPLIQEGLVVIRRRNNTVEVELRTDFLFPSGVESLVPKAIPVVNRLAEVLKNLPNSIRVEGHTDNVPITGPRFASNWELSAVRAATVVRLLISGGVDPLRLSAVGYGEFRPVADNTLVEGRNQNRRVLLVLIGKSNEKPNNP